MRWRLRGEEGKMSGDLEELNDAIDIRSVYKDRISTQCGTSAISIRANPRRT